MEGHGLPDYLVRRQRVVFLLTGFLSLASFNGNNAVTMGITMINWDDQMDEATERDNRLVSEREEQNSGHAGAVSNAETSLYERAIAAAAARRGVSPETIMQEDYEGLVHAAGYPSPECLTPDEMETIYLNDSVNGAGWIMNRLRHVKDCPSCRELFVCIHPDAKSRQRFNQALEQALIARVAAVGGTETKTILGRIREAAAAFGRKLGT